VVIMVLSFLPASNLFFYVGFVLAERVLYVPSVGFCLLSAHAAARALAAKRQIARRLAAICVSLLLLASGLRTLVRNRDWRDEESLYTAGLRINPPKGRCLPKSHPIMSPSC
jgi:predicted Kef-type K+ transport protein